MPCWYVYTAVYMLAADGAVFDTHDKKSMVRGTPKRKPTANDKKSMVRGTPKRKPTAAVLCSRDT